MQPGYRFIRAWTAPLLLAAALPICAQEPAATFRTTTRLVEISVTALDGDGNPVTDLTEDDHWTEIHYADATFDLVLPEYLFTLSNLSNPRPWSAP